MTALTCTGTAGEGVVVFAPEPCSGCSGSCGARLGNAPLWPLPRHIDAPRGAAISLSTSASRLAGETLLLFGTPVACVAATAFAVEAAASAIWPVALALLGSTLATLLARRLLMRAPPASLIVRERHPPQRTHADDC